MGRSLFRKDPDDLHPVFIVVVRISLGLRDTPCGFAVWLDLLRAGREGSTEIFPVVGSGPIAWPRRQVGRNQKISLHIPENKM